MKLADKIGTLIWEFQLAGEDFLNAETWKETATVTVKIITILVKCVLLLSFSMLVTAGSAGLVASFLWNRLMPKFFHLPTMNLYEATGFLVLAWLVIGVRIRIPDRSKRET